MDHQCRVFNVEYSMEHRGLTKDTITTVTNLITRLQISIKDKAKTAQKLPAMFLIYIGLGALSTIYKYILVNANNFEKKV